MAGGMLTKQADFLTAKYLNDVNDSVAGGAVVSVPSGAPSPQVSQTLPGDRIVLDDATALALSDTAVGTLYGGIYMYVGATYTTTAPAKGQIAFWTATNLTGGVYTVNGDAQPTTAIPSYIAGIFINAITKAYYGWIQIAGLATVLFDGALTAAAAGNWVSAKVSPSNASTADNGAVAGVVTLAAMLGVAVGLPGTSAASTVLLTRSPFGRL
jgi:hypothetical protein